MNTKVSKTIDALRKNGFDVQYFHTSKAAKDELLSRVPKKMDIGIGGSMTVFSMDLHKNFIEMGHNVYWHWLVEPDKRDETRLEASATPVYLTGTNSITEDGKLVNIDGIGNRVASMFYGHEDVYVLAGINKITENVEAAIMRTKEEACPKNAERLNLNTPCRHTGRCHDCNSEHRMCNVTVILDKNPGRTNIHIYLIDEVLGY